jgi:hypothetical protein
MHTLSSEELKHVYGGGDCCYAPCPPAGGPQGNNGWGNGEDAAPGNSLAAQSGFEDPDTTTSPSNSAASGGGNR